MDFSSEALLLHKKYKGKLEINPLVPLETREQLATAYTPGVAAPCLEIARDESLSYDYTRKGNLVAVVTDGTAVLGLGDIGPRGAMPVMEGKAALFKRFAGVDAFPVCLDTKDAEEIIKTVKLMAPTFGGINLEDISSPRCFEIEKRLTEELDIPVFHDDQHGTAIVVLAGLINALKFVGKDIQNIKAAICGAGAAGIAIAKLLIGAGLRDITLCGRKGIIYEGSPGQNAAQAEIARLVNPAGRSGDLADAVRGADVFIGVSAAGLLLPEMVRTMAGGAIVFAMANPVPEIFPDEAISAGAAVVGTGRSDYPNQINNVLAFPGIFRGALDARAKRITDEMKIAAAFAIAGLVGEGELGENMIIPDPFDERVANAVAKAVYAAAPK